MDWLLEITEVAYSVSNDRIRNRCEKLNALA